MVENRNRNWLLSDFPAQIAPAPTGTPRRIALPALTGQINAVHTRVVEFRHRCGPAARVREHLSFIRRHFESATHAQPEHSILRVSKNNLLVLRLQSRDAIDAPKVRSALESVPRVLFQQDLF